MTRNERRAIVRSLRWTGNPLTGGSLLLLLLLLSNDFESLPMYDDEGGRTILFYFLIGLIGLGVLLLLIAVVIYHLPMSEAELRKEASEAYERRMAEKQAREGSVGAENAAASDLSPHGHASDSDEGGHRDRERESL